MDIRAEIQSIRDFVAPELPGVTFHLQNIPEAYKPSALAIEFSKGSAESETAYHYRNDHLFQLVYFGTSKLDCVTKMQAIERKLNDKQMIPMSGRYLKIASFSLSQAFKTETTGVFAIIGMLEIKVREARNQQRYDKIEEVHPTIKPNINIEIDI